MLTGQIRAAAREDLRTAEFTSLPITLLVLVLVFGGLVAAGLPVIAAVISVAAAMAVMLGFSTFTDVDADGVTVVTLLGLGLSVDYGLLLVARYREELLGAHQPEVAIARAWATAGRTILFSALTVAAALTGLLMFDLPALTALGAAGVSIAVVSMLVSLTLTAALIGSCNGGSVRPSTAGGPTWRPRCAARGRNDAGRASLTVARGLRRFRLAVRAGPATRPAGRRTHRRGLLAAGLPLLSAQVRLPGIEAVPR